jgi:cell filamentation protein
MFPRGSPPDPYVYPGTEVLKNLGDLRDPRRLEVFERQVTNDRLLDLQRAPVRGSFDLAHYSDTHHAIFQDVYPWAGQFRTTEISKWSDQRQDWAHFEEASKVPTLLANYLRQELSPKEKLRSLSADEFVVRSTRLYVALNAIQRERAMAGLSGSSSVPSR